MRMTNYIQFANCPPQKLPSARETIFHYAHANREDMMKLRKIVRREAKDE